MLFSKTKDFYNISQLLQKIEKLWSLKAWIIYVNSKFKIVSMSLETIKQEPKRLQSELQTINTNLNDLCLIHYNIFINNYLCNEELKDNVLSTTILDFNHFIKYK